ncbi:MAG TPA: S8 family serine peptidase [Longimicrobium sp.]|jgi:subtilisin family serine protease|uniref:S8 family serine peptidase n=1 Tax=Longimicrobium sp. TaxID=2029185 RepID=UPI002EDA887D
MKRAVPLFLAGVTGLSACSDLSPVATGLGANSPVALNVSAAPAEIVPGQIIVRFRPGAARSEIAQQHRARKKDDMLLERTEILEVPVGEEAAIAAQLSRNPNVEFAEPDAIMRVGPCETSVSCDLPDGDIALYKWDLHNTGTMDMTPQGWGIVTTGKVDADIDWAETYDHLGPNFAGSATIAILDTGIRTTHPAFVGKIVGGRRFLSDTTTVAKNNVTDDNGHGSHVAGIAASRADVRIPGVAYGTNIKLLVAKVCNSAGSCPNSATANAIVWAADNGANVINMSLGAFGGNPDGTGSAAQQAAMQYALAKEALPVCATGNDDNKVGNGYTGGVGYPARFPECMAVGATNWSDTKASYSNYGAQIEISAPGGDSNPKNTAASFILAPLHSSNSYTWKTGTSMATPQVAGLAALLYATGMTRAADVRARMIQTADDVEAPGWDNRTGAGRINVYRAVTGKDPNAAPVAAPGSGYAGNKGVAVQFDGSASNDPNGKPVTFAWNFGDPASGAANASTLASPTHTYLRAGSYTVTLTVKDAAGLTTTTTTTAVIANIAPNVSGIAGATLLPGERYTAAGSFSDADPDSWTATVDYGDGTGSQGLALSGKSFSLSHVYTAAGTHTVLVTVADDDGGAGTGSASVTVLTAQQGIQATLLAPVAASGMGSGTVTALSATLQAARESLDRGNHTAATQQLQAFINQVEAQVRSGRMTAAMGADLSAAATRVIASFNR